MSSAPVATNLAAAVQWAAWQPSTPYSVGLEEEVMLLDPGTWTLAQRADRLLAVVGDDLVGSCSAETHEAALELITSPHATVGAAIAELGRLRARLTRDARAIGLLSLSRRLPDRVGKNGLSGAGASSDASRTRWL